MFTIGSVDVTFLIPLLLCLMLFALQLLLCFKAKHMAVKLIPLYFIAAVLLLALYIALFVDGSGFLDLSGVLALYVAAVGGVMGLFVGAAWLLHKLITRKQ